MLKHDFAQMDEMQKEKLLKINSTGMKLCAFGLLGVILIQWFMNRDFSCVMGELAVFDHQNLSAVAACLCRGHQARIARADHQDLGRDGFGDFRFVDCRRFAQPVRGG